MKSLLIAFVVLLALASAEMTCCVEDRCVFVDSYAMDEDNLNYLCNNDAHMCTPQCSDFEDFESVEGEPSTSDEPLIGCVTRQSMLSRARRWIDLGITYSQQRQYEGWRTDCSGFVSMAHGGIPKPGDTTSTFISRGHAKWINKSELAPGDLLLSPGKHVLMFVAWADSGKTKYSAYEMTPPKAISRVTPYPYWPNSSSGPYKPARFTNVC
ncbi:hypothetical protein RCL1_002040 [Eukaryota sp. TZLM3-RCL]